MSKLWEITQRWSDPESGAYYERVSRAFKNFKTFLSDNAVLIDHTYLWDYVCMPGVVEKKGINLVILELDLETAMTNSVNILCPTNPDVSNVFDPSKTTAIIISKKETILNLFSKEREKINIFLISIIRN